MKLSLAAAAAAALVAALVVAAHVPAAPAVEQAPVAADQPGFFAPPRVQVQYGHIRSLVRRGNRYELRFDPAFWLGGVTANRAAREDGAIGPGETVPNDYYIRDESRRPLTYLVPGSVQATVLVNGARGIRSLRVGVPELAAIVRGRNPRNRRLFDRGNDLGYWIRVATDTVRSLDQQYQP
jgi:hypothetical protein